MKKNVKQIAVVTEKNSNFESIQKILNQNTNYRIFCLNFEELSNEFDLIFLDLMPDEKPDYKLLSKVNLNYPGIPIVVLANRDEKVGLQAIKHGAQDYILEDEFDERIVGRIVRYSIEQSGVQESLRKFSRAVEQSASAVIITDTEGHIEFVNPKFVKMSGYSAEDVIGRHSRILKSGEQPDSVYADLWHTISKGGEWRGEFHNRKKNGEFYWDFSSISPIRNQEGTITHYLAIKEDITERKRSDERLSWLASFPMLNPNPIIEIDHDGNVVYLNPSARVQFPNIAKMKQGHPIIESLVSSYRVFETGRNQYHVAEAEILEKTYELHCSYISDSQNIRAYILDISERRKMERLKEEFVSNISHELRTPLTAIMNAIANMVDGVTGEFNERQKRYLDMSQRNVHRLSSLINDLLDISRIEANRMKLKCNKVFLNTIVDNILVSFRASLETKKLSVKSKASKDLPAIFADSDRLSQILINLIGNSIKFTPEGGSITIAAKVKDKNLEISVKDTGVGIPDDKIHEIFDRFQQVKKQTVSTTVGSGLGLSITKELVALHGGKISVESKVNKGSKFIFTIPLYTHRLAYRDFIQRSIGDIKDPQVPLTIIKVLLTDRESIINKQGEDEYIKIFEIIERLIRKQLRRGTDLFLEKGMGELVALLIDADKENAHHVVNRICGAIDSLENVETIVSEGSVGISISMINYPEDVMNNHDLINHEGMVVEALTLS